MILTLAKLPASNLFSVPAGNLPALSGISAARAPMGHVVHATIGLSVRHVKGSESRRSPKVALTSAGCRRKRYPPASREGSDGRFRHEFDAFALRPDNDGQLFRVLTSTLPKSVPGEVIQAVQFARITPIRIATDR